MVYEEFLHEITEQLHRELGSEYQIMIRKIPKNNGITLDGLCIHSKELPVAPAIYLNSYFEQYQHGMSFEEVIQDILKLYRTTCIPDILQDTEFSSLERFQDRIMFKLIHAASNAEQLKDLPHIHYLDLAVVFYLYLDHSDSGQMTAMIHTCHMEAWHLKIKDLWQFALANTPATFPAQIRNMNDTMKEIARENLGDEYREDLLDSLLDDEECLSPLYVLSNQTGLNGAGCMLYRNVLKDFADSVGSNLIILPSSIHEVLITPDTPGVSYEELSDMVTAINQHEVACEERLSNQVYLYTRSNDRICIASHGSDLVGNLPDSAGH